LPPRFQDTSASDDAATHAFIYQLYPPSAHIQISFMPVLRQCLACLLFSHDYIKGLINTNNKFLLKHSPLFKLPLPSIARSVSVGFQWKSTDAPIVEGIPPHVTHLTQMQKLFEQQKNLGGTILLDDQRMLDNIIFAMDEHVTGNGL
jgi:hypothetical protein